MAAFEFSDDLADLAALDAQLSSLDGNISWSVSADGLTLTGNDGAADVMTITVTGATINGDGHVVYAYTAELLGPLEHDVNTLEDLASLSGVAFAVTDSDGDEQGGNDGTDNNSK